MSVAVTVTQADREAVAENVLRRLQFTHGGVSCWMEDACNSIRRGREDDLPEVQAFARHRQSAEASFRAREAALVEALEDLATREAEYRHEHDIYGDGNIMTGRAWDRMRRAGDRARALLARATTPDAGGV